MAARKRESAEAVPEFTPIEIDLVPDETFVPIEVAFTPTPPPDAAPEKEI